MSMLVRKGTMLHRASTRRHKKTSNNIKNNNNNNINRKGSVKNRTPSPRCGKLTQAASITPNTVKSDTIIVVTSDNADATATVTKSPNADYLSTVDDRKIIVYDYKSAESSTMTSYGSFSYQLQTAGEESNGICEFVCRALEIFGNTVAVTILIICGLFFTFAMVIFGIQYLENCPKEPNIPVYLLVAGCFGLLKMASLLWRQTQSRRYDRLDYTFHDSDLEDVTPSTSSRVIHHALTLFLVAWFALGNYWIFRIYMPVYQPLLLEPNNWCHQNVYTFALAHCYICYFVMATFTLLVIILTFGHLCGCI